MLHGEPTDAPVTETLPAPEVYDFARPSTLAREHARVLELAFETFARQWGNQLTARLRVMAQVNLDGLSLSTYDEYVRGLPGTTAMMLCTIEQSRQTAVVQVPVSTTDRASRVMTAALRKAPEGTA